jgi:hypothetical protein
VLDDDGAQDAPLRLEVDLAALTEEFTGELGALFAEAVPLPLEAPDQAGLTLDERERAIREAALDAEVDVVVWPELEYSPRVTTRANEKLWLNLPLFLIGGPLNWFPNDRSYFVDATLAFHVLDAAKLQDTLIARLRDRALVLGRSSADEVELDLFDRAGRGVGHYALGILVPGVALARHTDRAREAVASEVRRELARQAVAEIAREADELVRGSAVVDFHPRLELRPVGDHYELAGDVVLNDTRVQYLAQLEVEIPGRGRVVQEFEDVGFEDVPFGSVARRLYPVEPVRVDADQARAGLRVTIFDSARVYRTFTYRAR